MNKELARRDVGGERRGRLLVFKEWTEQMNEQELEEHAIERLVWISLRLWTSLSLLHDKHIWQLTLSGVHLFWKVLAPSFQSSM